MISKNYKKVFFGIPGVTVLIISVICISIIFLDPKKNDGFEIIGIILSAIIGVSTFLLIFHEYRRLRKIEEGQFIFSLNSEFINNDDTKAIYDKIYNEQKDSSLQLINKNDVTQIVSYLTFLETFWTLRKRGIIDVDMINDLFANRFFLIITNKNVQELKLLKEYHLYHNIRLLEIKWREFRTNKGLKNLYYENSFYRQIPKQIAVNHFYSKDRKLKNNTKLTFRIFNTSDLDSIYSLQNDIIKGMEKEELLLKTTKQEFKNLIENEKNVCLGVFSNTNLVAYTFLTYPKWNFKVFKKRFLFAMFHKNNMYFKVMAVHNDYRNMGISSSFIEVAKKVAALNQTNRIITTVHPENTISNLVMSNNGFKKIKTKKIHKNMPRNIYELVC